MKTPGLLIRSLLVIGTKVSEIVRFKNMASLDWTYIVSVVVFKKGTGVTLGTLI